MESAQAEEAEALLLMMRLLADYRQGVVDRVESTVAPEKS